jgi:hypothetical protein
MRHAESKSKPNASESLVPHGARAVPTFIATDLLEKLIEDRDALAVRKVVSEGRHN